MIKESLFAAEERETKLDKLGDVLQVLEKHVDFAALAAAIDKAAPRPSRERGGRPPFPTGIMVRTLLLQQLYNLSDEQLEFQLLDRLSFQRFVGLRHSSQIPDRTTFWTFRERLMAAGADGTIFEAANRELDKHGYLARGGQIIDASIVPAPKQHLRKGEKALIKGQAMPIDWPPAKRRQKDIDATWTQKHGKSYFGYKLSANADKRYKLIRQVKISTASEHDTLHLEDILDPTIPAKTCMLTKAMWTKRAKHDSRPRVCGFISNVKPPKANRCQTAKRGAIPESPRHGPGSNMCSPAWNRWAAKACAASDWVAPPCNLTSRRPPIICAAYAV